MSAITIIALVTTLAAMVQTALWPFKADLYIAQIFIQRAKGSLLLYLFQWLSVFAFVFLVTFLALLLLETVLPPVP